MKTVISWLVIVFVISIYPFEGASSVPFADKIVHFIIYAITAALFFVILKNKMLFSRALALSVVFSAGYGFLMEIAQSLSPSRDFSLLDGLANILGALSGAVFIALTRREK